MSRTRSGFGPGLLHALVAGLTTWFALLAWSPFSTASASYLVPLLVGSLAITTLGAGLRWLRVHGAVIVLAQLALGFAIVNIVVAGSPIPLGQRWHSLTTAVHDAVSATQVYAAPVPSAVANIAPLMLPLGLAFAVLVDVFAGTLHRVPLAGLPLLTIYAIPIGLLPNGVPWWVFTLCTAGFLLMLFLHEEDQVNRWGRPIGATTDARPRGRPGAIRGTAAGIGAAAAALALTLPTVIPTLHLAVFGFGDGPGNGEVHVANPITDLRRDLQRPSDFPLLQVTTDDPDPSYLRLTALTRFNGDQWSAGDRTIPTSQSATGPLPELSGVSAAVARDDYGYQVSINDRFVSTWLPTFATSTSVTAPGDWRYDTSTMDFIAADEGTDTKGLAYELQAAHLHLKGSELATAGSIGGSLRDTYTALPTLPDEVRRLAISVTAGQPSRFQEADALQDWFRRSGGFRYDIHSAPGNGNSALVDFLDNRVGYCEQFASAMAVMARSIGLPARVAIGFLHPDRVGKNLYEYSTHDLHAWVEIYFPGSGWVLFDPTPASVSGAAPPYTQGRIGSGPGASASNTPSLRPSDRSTSAAPATRPDSTTQKSTGSESSGFSKVPWLVIGSTLGTLLVGALALLVPQLLRRMRREHRWRAWPAPEAAWAELADTMTDLGNPWPRGLSPRAAAAVVGTYFGGDDGTDTDLRPRRGPGVNPGADVALAGIVTSLERHRYAAAGKALPGERLEAEVETCVGALYGGATVRARRRARWLPRTVLQRPRRAAPAGNIEVIGQGGLVDHVG